MIFNKSCLKDNTNNLTVEVGNTPDGKKILNITAFAQNKSFEEKTYSFVALNFHGNLFTIFSTDKDDNSLDILFITIKFIKENPLARVSVKIKDYSPEDLEKNKKGLLTTNEFLFRAEDLEVSHGKVNKI